MWRCSAAHDALRGGTCTAYSRRKMVVAEGMGRASGPATRDASSDRRGRQGVWLSFCTGCGSMVASSGGARTAPRLLRLPEAAAKNARKTALKEEINAACFAEKCPLGDDGWGEFVAAADPAARSAARAPDRLGLP